MNEPPKRSELTWKYGKNNKIINPKINDKRCSVKRAEEILSSFSSALYQSI